MNDLISRQAAIDALRNEENHAFNSYYRGLVKAHKIIADLPPVTPQPKTGHWIRVDKTKVKCSECEITHMIAQYPNGKIAWCPNCGAKMIEPHESEV